MDNFKLTKSESKVIVAQNYIDEILKSDKKENYIKRLLEYRKHVNLNSIVDKIALGLGVTSVSLSGFASIVEPTPLNISVPLCVSAILATYICFIKTRAVKAVMEDYEKEKNIDEEFFDRKNDCPYLDNKEETQQKIGELKYGEFKSLIKYVQVKYSKDIENIQIKQKAEKPSILKTITTLIREA